MASSQQEHDAPAAPIVKFRSATRKNFRQRPQGLQHHDQHDQHDQQRQASPSSPPHTSHDEAESPSSSVRAALRARMARKPRLRGVAFSTDSQADDHAVRPPADGDADEENKLVVAKAIPDRFMHQTGLVATLNDKHIRAAPPPSRSHDEYADTVNTASSSSEVRQRAVQPTRQGKIVEVDLRSQPLPMSDDPRKRKPDASLSAAPRRRDRRGSDDAKRDQLVEAFLHENKLQVYDMPTRRSGNGPRDGRSADDRMAEEFRRRFFDEMALRRQRKKAIPPTRQQRELREMRASEVLKGPKLGGSRNNRAAVRNILLNQEKEKLGRKPR
ncbi:hypothetical protein E4U42_000136 [Claviceps africana]|uniref:mRNA splicing factor RNA helicase n=1 Tax=Claviceps africana TaxID=83212 RepID=A0A8K0JD41_9HYPO|nr:hypothetical protein E4U42_000136 [Claviceps africana]